MKQLPNKNLLAIMISSALLMTGCGGGEDGAGSLLDRALDSGTSDTDTPSGDNNNNGSSQPSATGGSEAAENPFVGASSILGSISLSSLTGQDASALESGEQTPKRAIISTRSAFIAPRAATDTADNAIIKLYSVAANGVLEDTGIDCKFSPDKDAGGNPKYFCEGVADGKNYVVKYLRILDGNRALEMKVNVSVPEGVAEAPADEISPQSTVVVDAIVNAVLSATEGKEIDEAVIKDIITSVKSAVENLVNTGAVQVPSMVVDAPKDEAGQFVSDVAKLKKDKKLKFAANEGLEAVTGSVLSSEKVAREIDAVKVEIEIKEFSRIDTQGVAGKKAMVAKIFSKLLGEDDVPRFIVDFFADRYEKGDTKPIGDIFNAVNAGLRINPELGVDLEELALSPEEAVAALQDLLGEIYSLQDKKAANALTEEEKEKLAEIPAIISAVFPAQQWRGVEITPETVFDVPQGIVFTIFVTDEYVPDVYEEVTEKPLEAIMSVDSENEGSKDVEFDRPIDFDPMGFDEAGENPGLMQLYGFFAGDYLENLSGVDISHLDISPDKAWIPEEGANGPGGKEVDMMRANVCVMDLSRMASMNGDSEVSSQLSVELSYPTSSGGYSTVSLLNEREIRFDDRKGSDGDRGLPEEEGGTQGPRPGEGEGPELDSCFTLDPWAMARRAQGNSGTDDFVQLRAEDIISDFVSGEYTVTVKDAGAVVAERKFKRKVIVGMQNAVPVLTSPRARPQWPVECNGKNYCEKWQKLNEDWEKAGGNTTFAVNTDDGRAKVTVTWRKPEVKLPEGVKLAYSLNVFKQGQCEEGGRDCRPENIYSSHERNRRLFGLSFTIPRLLDKLELGEGRYNTNLCAEFIDTSTGDYLGSGGCAFAEFNVGAPLNLDNRFDILGRAIPGKEGKWKVALISEAQPKPDANGKFQEPERKVIAWSEIHEDGGYQLSPSIGDFLGASLNTHFSVVMFDDENGDGEVTVGPDTREHMIWPEWNSNVRFETWGRVLRAVSEHQGKDDGASRIERKEILITGGEEVRGPDFKLFPGGFGAGSSTTGEAAENDAQAPGDYDPEKGEYGPGPGDYDPEKGEYSPGPGDYDPEKGEYGPGPGDYDPEKGEYGPGPGDYDPEKGEYGPGPGDYDPEKGEYGPGPGDYDSEQGGYGPGEGEYGSEQGDSDPGEEGYDPEQGGDVPAGEGYDPDGGSQEGGTDTAGVPVAG